MKILIVNAFSNNSKGQRKFSAFVKIVYGVSTGRGPSSPFAPPFSCFRA